MTTQPRDFRPKTGLFLFLAILPLLGLTAQGDAAPAAPLADRRILILTSYGDGRPGVDAVLSGFLTTLVEKGLSVEQVYTEHLDLQRNKDPAFLESLAATLKLKYQEKRIDLVYAVEQPALDFLLRRLRGVASGATVIVARATLPPDLDPEGRRFVRQLESYDIPRTLGLARALFPSAGEFVFIAGSSLSDQAIAAQAAEALRQIAPRMAFRDTRGMSLEEVKALLASPPGSSLILVLPFNSDSRGRTTVQMEIAFMAAATARAPVFTLWDNPVGRGAVGGAVTEFFSVGKQAGLAAVDRLSGGGNPEFGGPTLPSVTTLKLDWAQVRRWGGKTGSLPEGIVYINRPPSLWEQYRGFVIAILSLIAAQTGLIVALLVQRSMRIGAQKTLMESRESFRLLMEQAPEAIVVYDAERERFVDANAKAEELFGCDRASIKELGITRFYSAGQPGGLAPEESFSKNADLAAGETPLIFTRAIRNARGEDFLCEVRMVRLPAAEGTLLRASFIDITARVRAEEGLKQSLREKEVLLQEVYHRTKNNMQVIASLLDMQAMRIEDEEVKSLLADMVGRIQAMSLVHQKLYQSKDLSRIDLKDYFQDLVVHISSSASKKERIGIRLDLEEGIIASLDIAMPCGLIVNELLTNSFKHAFGPDGRGTIRVGLARREDRSLLLTVSDDGRGFPAGLDPRRDAKMGLMTVFALVESQLGGSIELSPGPGTAYTIAFRNDLRPPRV